MAVSLRRRKFCSDSVPASAMASTVAFKVFPAGRQLDQTVISVPHNGVSSTFPGWTSSVNLM
ncbi:hypothetical protein JOD27_001583 [Lentzea nigeriaca]|nr:hypothetical protein [Lentzea nigeriaca]